jgi:N-acyl-D-amino-acid deacylase
MDTYIEHLNKLELGSNVTFLVGHGNIRVAAMGYVADKATPADLEKMQEITRRCMKAGAMGVSFGLIYPPGSYADTEEMIAVAKIVAEYGGVITAHIRGEGIQLIEATDELLRVARATGVRTVHSHHKASGGPMNWNKTAATIAMMEKQISRLENDLDAKEQEIKRLQARVQELETESIIFRNGESIEKYPFEMGVSDKNEQKRTHV